MNYFPITSKVRLQMYFVKVRKYFLSLYQRIPTSRGLKTLDENQFSILTRYVASVSCSLVGNRQDLKMVLYSKFWNVILQISKNRSLCVNITSLRTHAVGKPQAIPVVVYDYYKPGMGGSGNWNYNSLTLNALSYRHSFVEVQ